MIMMATVSGEEGVGGGGGGGGKQRHNSADKNIREFFPKHHPPSSPVRHTGTKSPSPQGANYPMVSEVLFTKRGFTVHIGIFNVTVNNLNLA